MSRICLQCRRPGFSPWLRKIPWRKEWQPTPTFLPGEFHRRRSLAGYSPRGCKESDMTEWLTDTHTHTHTHSVAHKIHGFQFQLCYFLAVWPWASNLTLKKVPHFLYLQNGLLIVPPRVGWQSTSYHARHIISTMYSLSIRCYYMSLDIEFSLLLLNTYLGGGLHSFIHSFDHHVWTLAVAQALFWPWRQDPWPRGVHSLEMDSQLPNYLM